MKLEIFTSVHFTSYYYVQVGAVLVKNGEVIAEGCNRMPRGCEDRFTWDSKEDKPLQDGKHLYGESSLCQSIPPNAGCFKSCDRKRNQYLNLLL